MTRLDLSLSFFLQAFVFSLAPKSAEAKKLARENKKKGKKGADPLMLAAR